MSTHRNVARANISSMKLVSMITVVVIVMGFPLVSSQPGFLSIDCGNSESYTDSSTGIKWVPDGTYTSTGLNYGRDTDTRYSQISSYGTQRQLGTIRRFTDSTPTRNRDCYNLPTKANTRYLIRSLFLLSMETVGISYDIIQFDLYLNTSLIRSLYFDYYASLLNFPIQIIFQSPGGNVSLCLIRITGYSFITSLELRELEDGMYSYNFEGKSLNDSSIFLLNYLSAAVGTNNEYFRYPNDPYDRWWTPYNNEVSAWFRNFSIISNRTSIPAANRTAAPNLPPVSVMESAFVGYETVNVSIPLGSLPNIPFYITAYFQELDGNASSTNVRGMDLFLNDQRLESFNSSNEVVQVQKRFVPVNDGTGYVINIAPASWSRLPAMLNGIEIHTVIEVNTSHTAQEDVDAVTALTAGIPMVTPWQGDPCLPVPFYWLKCAVDDDNITYRITNLIFDSTNISGAFPQEILMLGALTSLSMSNNTLTGSIPNLNKMSSLKDLTLHHNKLDGDIENLRSLKHLESLNLENNSFTGSIPSFFSTFQSLSELHLDNNNFSGVIPASIEDKTGLNFTHSNNPNLIENDPSSKGSSELSRAALLAIIFGSILALAIVLAILWCILTRKRRATAKILEDMHKGDWESGGGKGGTPKPVLGEFASLRQFSLQEVSEATQRFSKKIGEGSFGSVFYGKLAEGQEVAVKVKKEASHQGVSEFRNELELLSRIHHRNLVSLVGYCGDQGQHILLYENLPNGSLDGYLHGDNPKPALDWKTRLAVSVNSATGLEYLHFHCNPQIIHRDVKSANILLDRNMIAKVSDFGISRQTFEGRTTGIDTAVKGTFGYLDPELFATERLTRMNDVYSFGIVLLEIISGCSPRPKEHPDGSYLSLIEWARSCVKDGNAFDIFDSTMENNFSYQSARMVLDLALQCTNPVLHRRPDMQQIVRQLAQAQQLEEPEQARASDENESGKHTEPSVYLQDLQGVLNTSGRFLGETKSSKENPRRSNDEVAERDIWISTI